MAFNQFVPNPFAQNPFVQNTGFGVVPVNPFGVPPQNLAFANAGTAGTAGLAGITARPATSGLPTLGPSFGVAGGVTPTPGLGVGTGLGGVPGVPGAVAGVPGAVPGIPGGVPGQVPGAPRPVPGAPTNLPGALPSAVPGAPAAGAAAAGPNPQLTAVIPQVLSAIMSLIQLMPGGGAAATAGTAGATGAKPAAGAAGPLTKDETVTSKAKSILDQGLNSITGLGAGQAKKAIQGGLGNVIGAVNVNGVTANLNFSVNDLPETLAYAKGLGLTAQNGRIDQPQLQAAIAKAESSGAPANVTNTLKSLNDNWAAGEQLGIVQGGAVTSAGVDKLLTILEDKAQGAAAAKGGIAASVGGKAVTNVFNTIKQPVRDLIRDSTGL